MEKKQDHSPGWARKLLLTFLRHDLAEEVQGDLEEKFLKTLQESGPWKAKWRYWYEVLNYVRPFAVKKQEKRKTSFIMINNYFKIAWRNLSRQAMFSSIKIGGFSLGIASCLLISLFIRQELSYEQENPDKNRIFRAVGVFDNDGDIQKDVYMSPPFASSVKSDFPEIESVARINAVKLFGAGSNQFKRADQDQNTYEEGFIYADPEIVELMHISVIYGNPKHALDEPKTILLTKSKAQQYFPNENPIGKMVVLNDNPNKLYKVNGVIEDAPPNSHLQYNFIITLKGLEFWPGEQTSWGSSNYYTYLLLREGTDPNELGKKMTRTVMEKYILPMLLAEGRHDAKELIKKAYLELQPLTDIHLHSEGIHDGLSHGDIRFVWLFGTIAGFILLIACINFINLSTARSANRAREVGLRKVVGSFREDLLGQFLTESIVFSMLSFVIGVTLAWLALPYFSQLAGRNLVLPWEDWWLAPLLLAAAVVVGVLAGIYPAFYLSAFKPIHVLKGNLSKGSGHSGLRSALVIFQFTTSIVLIAGTLIINRQMDFLLNRKIGFDKDQVLLIQGANTLKENVLTFKQELLRLPDVKSVSISDYLPISGAKRNGNQFYRDGRTTTEKNAGGQFWRVDHDYIKTMGMHLVAGRDFNISIRSDSQAVIINQKLAHDLGLENPVGERITNRPDNSVAYTVIGVVEDFNFESMREPINGVCMSIGRSQDIVSVKLSTGDLQETLKSVEALWKSTAPHQAIRYTFLDDEFAMTYADVKRMGIIFTCFAVLAMIVACLGLFALSAFVTEQRSREISIRLILGASLINILRQLTGNYLFLMAISILLATPLAWWLMKRWLEDFAYRIDLGADVFLISAALSVLIAILTVGYQSLKAALVNPVDNLRRD